MTISKLINDIEPMDTVSTVNQIIDGKQDVLVSGTNIKTINNNSILGSGNIEISGGGGESTVIAREIGELVQSPIPITNAGLHLIDGSLIQGNGVYSDFTDYIAKLVKPYPNLFISEVNWQASITNYGACGKFVYTPNYYAWTDTSVPSTIYTEVPNPVVGDTVYTKSGDIFVAESDVITAVTSDTITIESDTWSRDSESDEHVGSVRLPKIVGMTEGTIDATALGDLVEAGLPNITGSFTSWAGNDAYDIGSVAGTTVGCFSRVTGTQSAYLSQVDSSSNGTGGVLFDASDSNSIYGNSTTVQPQTIKCYYYIVVATFAQTNVQVNINTIATDLNGKADTDFTNVTSTAKKAVDSWGTPDYSAGISMGLPMYPVSTDTDTYTCPSSGFVVVSANKSSFGYTLYLEVNGVSVSYLMALSGFGASMYAIVNKGDVVSLTTDSTSTTWGVSYQVFYPFRGEA